MTVHYCWLLEALLGWINRQGASLRDGHVEFRGASRGGIHMGSTAKEQGARGRKRGEEAHEVPAKNFGAQTQRSPASSTALGHIRLVVPYGPENRSVQRAAPANRERFSQQYCRTAPLLCLCDPTIRVVTVLWIVHRD
jgi:hypothetical protein